MESNGVKIIEIEQNERGTIHLTLDVDGEEFELVITYLHPKETILEIFEMLAMIKRAFDLNELIYKRIHIHQYSLEMALTDQKLLKIIKNLYPDNVVHNSDIVFFSMKELGKVKEIFECYVRHRERFLIEYRNIIPQ